MTIPRDILINTESKLSLYCDKKIPKAIRDKLTLDYKVKGNTIILFERRPHFIYKNKKIECSIAKIKYLPITREWKLYYMDRNLRWRKYWNYEPKKRISTIIKEIDEDPTCIFWG